MKITKEYLKQVINEEMGNLGAEGLKPGSEDFKKVLAFIGKRIEASSGMVYENGTRISFMYKTTLAPTKTLPKGQRVSYAVRLDLNNPENSPELRDVNTNQTFTDIEIVKKRIGSLFDPSKSMGTTSLNITDVLKIIAWYQNSLHRNKNTEYLQQLGWL